MRFRYEAVNTSGNTVEGHVESASYDAALRQLQSQSLVPTELSETKNGQQVGGDDGSATRTDAEKVGVAEQILILRELSTLLRAGITLVTAVDSLASARVSTPAGGALRRAHRSLNAGQNVVTAIAEMAIPFPPYVSQLAATGEMTGKLAEALTDAARQMEYDDRIRQELRNSLTYPVILICAGIAAVLMIFLVVVPKFANFIKSNKAADLPEISLLVIKTGLFLQAHWLWLAMGFCIAAGLMAHSLSDAAGRTRWLERLGKLPLIGEWLFEAETGRWATTLGALLSNRVPILTALELSSDGLRFKAMREQVALVIRDVRAGSSLADAAARHDLVGPTGINLIRVGERSGELAQTVATLGELSMEAGRNRMKRFLVLVEPLAILIIGAVIAIIMIAIMMAITGFSTGRA